MVSRLCSRTLTVAVANCAARDAAPVVRPWREWGRQRRRLVPLAFLCRRDEQEHPKRKFTEPVALLSTQPVDLPLPRTASGLSFNLLALRARCDQEPTGGDALGQARP